MRLWTMQPPEVLTTIQTTGVFRCKKELSQNYEFLEEAYKWLVEQMEKRIPRPEGTELPVWAWHTRYWKNEKPDLTQCGYDAPGTEMVCIELEVPDEEVLLSEFDSWHFVLNDGWLSPARSEEEWEELDKWYKSLPSEEQERLKLESWETIFDVTPRKDPTNWHPNGEFVQATFWELRNDMVRGWEFFTVQDEIEEIKE